MFTIAKFVVVEDLKVLLFPTEREAAVKKEKIVCRSFVPNPVPFPE